MPNELTNGDSLRILHTGGTFAGEAVADPNISLGGFFSSTLAKLLTATPAAVVDLSILSVSGANGLGSGTLTIAGASSIQWTAPGGTIGTAVTINNGETKIVEDGANPSKFILITRTSATALVVGTTAIVLTDSLNNVFGFDNVSSVEASAGDSEYRCVGLRNASGISISNLRAWIAILGTPAVCGVARLTSSGAGTITTATNFNDWPASGWAHIRLAAGTTREIVYYGSRTSTSLNVPSNGRAQLGTTSSAGLSSDLIDAVPPIRIAKEAPSSQPNGYVQNIADENTAPTGLSWNVGLTSATGVSIGTVLTTNWNAIWIHRQIPAGLIASPTIINRINFGFDT